MQSMQSSYRVNSVIENTNIDGNIYRLRVEGDFNVRPGQFFMLRAWGREPLLSRPISIYDADKQSISFLYEVRGEGTRILGKLKCDDKVELLGPLGNGFDIEKIHGKIAIVTGGIGIAPMLYTAKNIVNSTIDVYAGFRDKIYTVDELKEYVDNIYISTDVGSHGHRGFITDIFNPSEYDLVLCCGPQIMMGKVIKLCNACATPVYVSMESHMACGVGACLVCTCKTVNGMKRTCKDGPVFLGRDVIIDA